MSGFASSHESVGSDTEEEALLTPDLTPAEQIRVEQVGLDQVLKERREREEAEFTEQHRQQKERLTSEVLERINLLYSQATAQFAAHDYSQALDTIRKAKNIITRIKLQHAVAAEVDALLLKIKTQIVSIEIKEAYDEALSLMDNKDYDAVLTKLKFCFDKRVLYVDSMTVEDIVMHTDLHAQANINQLLQRFNNELNEFKIDAAIRTLELAVVFSDKISNASNLQQYGYVPMRHIEDSLTKLKAFNNRKTTRPNAIASNVANSLRHKKLTLLDYAIIHCSIHNVLPEQWHKLDNVDQKELQQTLTKFWNERLQPESTCCGLLVTHYLPPANIEGVRADESFRVDLTAFLLQEYAQQPSVLDDVRIVQNFGVTKAAGMASNTMQLAMR